MWKKTKRTVIDFKFVKHESGGEKEKFKPKEYSKYILDAAKRKGKIPLEYVEGGLGYTHKLRDDVVTILKKEKARREEEKV